MLTRLWLPIAATGRQHQRPGEARRALTRPYRIGCGAGFSADRLEPAVDLVEVNSLAASTLPSGLLVGGAVVVTGAAGILFCWLRIRSGSLLAPIIAHAVINSSATAAAFVVLRW